MAKNSKAKRRYDKMLRLTCCIRAAGASYLAAVWCGRSGCLQVRERGVKSYSSRPGVALKCCWSDKRKWGWCEGGGEGSEGKRRRGHGVGGNFRKVSRAEDTPPSPASASEATGRQIHPGIIIFLFWIRFYSESGLSEGCACERCWVLATFQLSVTEQPDKRRHTR